MNPDYHPSENEPTNLIPKPDQPVHSAFSPLTFSHTRGPNVIQKVLSAHTATTRPVTIQNRPRGDARLQICRGEYPRPEPGLPLPVGGACMPDAGEPVERGLEKRMRPVGVKVFVVRAEV